MSKILFISDSHFGHINIIKYESEYRKYDSVEEMDLDMIEKWNAKVDDKDTVYHLGDFTFSKNERYVENILKQLKGIKILCKGNHDYWLKYGSLRKYFLTIDNYYEAEIDGKFFTMMHYPLQCWNKQHHGSINLFGHIHSSFHHGNMLIKNNQYNVGAEVNNLEPCTLEEIIENNKIWHKKKGILLL